MATQGRQNDPDELRGPALQDQGGRVPFKIARDEKPVFQEIKADRSARTTSDKRRTSRDRATCQNTWAEQLTIAATALIPVILQQRFRTTQRLRRPLVKHRRQGHQIGIKHSPRRRAHRTLTRHTQREEVTAALGNKLKMREEGQDRTEVDSCANLSSLRGGREHKTDE